MHLLVQPGVADRLFGNALLIQQGLNSRILACAPDPVSGDRIFQEPTAENLSTISTFSRRVNLLLTNIPLPDAGADPRELRPRTMKMTADAGRLWVEFHNAVEREMGPSGKFAPIKFLANKAPEHAARLGASIETYAEYKANILTVERLLSGVDLVQHYLHEALRIYSSIEDSPDLVLAEKALAWIRSLPEKDKRIRFPLQDLYQNGPRGIRYAAKAREIIKILVEHGYIVDVPGGAEFDGVRSREVFILTEGARR
jgi:hypothetical protein